MYVQNASCFYAGLLLILLIQLDSFKQIAQTGSDALGLGNVYLLNRLFLHFFQGFHAEADLAVLKPDDLHFDFVALIQHVLRSLHALLADLGYVYQTGKIIRETDECAVVLQSLYGSGQNTADLNAGNLFIPFFSFLFLFY